MSPSFNKQTGKLRSRAETVKPITVAEEEPVEASAAAAEESEASDGPDFFDYLAQIPAMKWGQVYSLYLYRLEPPVRNAGKFNFIEMYDRAVTEADVKSNHGGGKFRFILKNSETQRMERTIVFSIEGAPKFIAGQTLVTPAGETPAAPGGGAAAAPATAPTRAPGEMAEVLDKLGSILERGRESKAAPEAVFDQVSSILAKGMELGARQNGGQQPLGLVELVALLKELRPPETQKNGAKEIVEMLAVLREIQGEKKSVITEVKELLQDLGVDPNKLVSRLLNAGGGEGPDWKQTAVEKLGEAVKSLPGILSAMNQMQEANFRRVIDARRLAVSLAPPAVAGGVPTPPLGGAQPATVVETAPATNAVSVEEEAFNRILELIVECFDEGREGDDAASIVKMVAPDAVEMLRPLLGEVEQVKQFAAVNPVLGAIAGEDEFPEFVKKFVTEFAGTGRTPPGPRIVPAGSPEHDPQPA